MGFFDLLGLQTPNPFRSGQEITFIRFKTGTSDSSVQGGELAKQLRVEIETIVGQKIRRHFLFEGLSEAITNVGQHAYADSVPSNNRLWWLSASFCKADSMLSVTFFDHGLGIPTTLPRSGLVEAIRETVLKNWTDAQKIQAAMEIGRSSSGLKERGKGLQNLIFFAQSHPFGRLSIYSGFGFYSQTFSGPQNPPRVSSENLRYPVNGTLIEWKVKLR